MGKKAGYIMTGSWSEKAFKEVNLLGEAYHVASSKDNQYRYIPKFQRTILTKMMHIFI